MSGNAVAAMCYVGSGAGVRIEDDSAGAVVVVVVGLEYYAGD